MANSDPSRMTGLFAGLLSSASGTWIPMPTLRRMSSVAAWMLFFALMAYFLVRAIPKTGISELGLCELLLSVLGALVFAAGSLALFLWIGCQQYGFEKTSDETE